MVSLTNLRTIAETPLKVQFSPFLVKKNAVFMEKKVIDRLEAIEQGIIEKISSRHPIESALLVGDFKQNQRMDRCQSKKKYFFSPNFSSKPLFTQTQSVGQPHQLPYLSESFDLIVLSHLIEFIEDPLTICKELKRCLSKKGQLVVLAYTPLNFLSSKAKISCPRHTLSYLSELLKKVDLEIVAIGGYFSFLLQHTNSSLSQWIDKHLLSHCPFFCNAYFIHAKIMTLPLTPQPLASFSPAAFALARGME